MDLDHVKTVMILRGLFRITSGTSSELSSFSGATPEQVDAYLATRPDVVEPREGDGPWRMRRDTREIVRAEIAEGIARDPEHLSDLLRPGYRERLGGSLDGIDAILDDMGGQPAEAAATAEGRFLVARLHHASKAIRGLRGFGRDVSAEEARLAACRARMDVLLPHANVEKLAAEDSRGNP